ncbi:MAG: hypothetical protein LBG97_10145 [Coriobacteriales bacterium]|jgi:hypothetical protein|nr:hypothetical protein [Coriobacteriales bacterium]
MPSKIILKPLQNILTDCKYTKKLLEQMLGEFFCERDKDIETFLHNKAVDYELSGISRTYLYIVSNQKSDIVDVAAYFSIALTSINLADASSNRRSKILGKTPGSGFKDDFGGVLIAQLGRNDAFVTSEVNGERIIADCELTIEKGRKWLGGRVAYLDCKKALVGYYERFGYRLLSDVPSDTGLYKMFKMLPKLVAA